MQVESAAEPSEAEKAYSAKLAKLKQVKAFRGPFALTLAAQGSMAALQRSVLWLARILFVWRYETMHRVATQCSAVNLMQRSAAQRSAAQRSATQRNALQNRAVRCNAKCAVANTSWCIATLWYAEDSLGTLWHTGAVWRDPHGAAPRVPLPAQPLRPAPPQAGPALVATVAIGCRLVRLVALSGTGCVAALQLRKYTARHN